jgi:DNA (cytosine-5)-methyltransferase 1
MKGRLYGLDLFSGIGGNTIGLREWIKTVAYCEKDRHAQSVLLSRMQDGSIESAPIWDSSVTTLNKTHFDVPIDIIIAGFPCQDISVAGKGAGLEGKRSGLFFEIMRLAKEFKPTFIFLENVPAIRTRGLDTVVEELTKAGYDSRWCMLSAASIGAAHKRERWFLLAYARTNVANSGGARLERGKETRNTCFGEQNSEEQFAGCDKSNRSGTSESNLGRLADGLSVGMVEGKFNYLQSSYWQTEPSVSRVTTETKQRAERIKRLGNAVVPLQARTAFKYLMGLL